MKVLPYVQAICSEVLRFASITPFAPAHMLTADDVYKGYHIPAGTTILANSWAMATDAERYADPLEFKPERWLSTSDIEKARGLQASDFAFGFGRRICPGQTWAENLLFIVVASVLTTFNIEKAIGEDGKPIPPNEEYRPGFVRTLGPTKYKIIPRSQKMVSLIQNAAEGN